MNVLPNGIGSAAALGSLTLGTVAAITLTHARAMTTAALEKIVQGTDPPMISGADRRGGASEAGLVCRQPGEGGYDTD